MASFITGLLVLGRIAAACWSNVLQKRAINDLRAWGVPPTALEMLVAVLTLSTIALAPWWLMAVYSTVSSTKHLDSSGAYESLAFWGWMAIACCLEVPGNFLLLRSIQCTDLSIFGPLNSYKPVVGMLLAWCILAELPTVFGVVGMVIVLLGSLMLADHSQSLTQLGARQYCFGVQHRGVRDRLIAVALTAAGSIFLKLAMQYQNAITSLAAWSLLSWLLALGWLNWDRWSARCRITSMVLRRDVIGIAASMLVMQGLTILVFQAMNVGYALSLFQLGSLVSVYLGYRIFGELDFWRRLAAASIMFVGAAIIMLAG